MIEPRPSKVTIGFGWPLLLIFTGSMAWGWKGAFYAIALVFVMFMIVPILAVLVKRNR